MRVNRRISSALVMIFVLLLSTSLPVAAKSSSFIRNNTVVFTAINFVSNIETIGVAVSGTGLPPTTQLSYRQSGEPLWHPGHPLVRIDDGRLIGSLFNLLPATSYEIKVGDDSSEINASASTQTDELSFTPSVILNVDDNALPGGDGSATAPFQTVQDAVNHAGPGTQVLVADGIYRDAVTFPASGTPGNWIQVKAAGNAAILDSADRLSGAIWTLYSGSHVWFTRISGPVAYLARDGKRYYQYDDRTGLMQARGHSGITMNEGWYYEASTLRLYVRSLDDPADHTWQVPRLNHAFDLVAHDWIWIEGFGIQFYGTTTNGCGVCTLNASHVVILRNKIHNMQLGIFINWNGTDLQGNDTRIEGNEVYDPLVNEWPWAAVKGSFMEGTGIIIRGHIGAIVRENNVHNFFNGIYTGSSGALENPELAFDADIYDNYIHHISDDGLEPEGACINQRFRNNTVDRSFIGISIAPITQGPSWVLHNVFTNFIGRGIKFANNSDGIVLIYHNTAWTNTANINGADLITSIHNVKMRNNIFQSTGYSIYEVPIGSTGNDWNHDNWYTTRGSTGPHFKWENINYNTISALCAASGLECNGYENLPGFTNPSGGDFTLLSSSPNIDRGVVIPGINDDFAGNAPDVGAYELAVNLPPIVLSSVRANSNPTDASSVGFTINFSEPVTGVDQDDFALTKTGVMNASISAVSGSGTTYTVTVNTGTGNGTIRLDVVDNDSIKDAMNNPLGGVGAGNGNFSDGETYLIIKSVDITGNVGLATVTLSYIDVTLKTATSDGGGNYSITVPFGWTGTVTPYKTGYLFTPLNRSYISVQGNLSAQNYTAQACASCAHINVRVASMLLGAYTLGSSQSTRDSYVNVDNGPATVLSTNGVPLIASTAINLKKLPDYLSYTEFMGIPASKLTDTYIFPWYNNATAGGLSSQLRFGNVGNAETDVTVKIGGVSYGPYHLGLNASQRVSFDNVDAGPVEVKSSDGVPIIASMRINLKSMPIYSSYTEFLGLSASSTAGTKYIFPWYGNANAGGVQSQLRFGNVGGGTTTVTIKIGGVTQSPTYILDPNESQRVIFDNLDAGPLEVTSSGGVPIIASMRVNLKTNPTYSSYSEFIGLPGATLTETRYLFPWYNNATAGGLQSQLRFGNVGNAETDVMVKIGGVLYGPYHLGLNASQRLSFDNLDAGPVEVFSSGGVPIIASMRINLKTNALYSSYSEFMGLSMGAPLGMPGNQLSTTYWFPWYNNATAGGLSSQLRFGVP